MSGGERWWLVSDLHLDVADEDPRRAADVLPGFLRRNVLASNGSPQHVVFVGDSFELVRLSERETLTRLESILDRYPATSGILRECAARGVRLHFMCGNHDVELARPAAAARLAEMLSPADPARVRVHPWFLYVPGVLLAEHGHQHHALHRIPEVLRTAVNGTDGLGTAPLAAWHAHPSQSAVGRAGAVARACLASERAERRIRTPDYDGLLELESRRLALDKAAVRDLARLSRFRTVTAVPVAATRMALAAAGRSIAAEKTPAAAERVTRTLHAHGIGVPWYISAHTHRALESPVEAGSTRYINTGTWSSDVRGSGPDQADRGAYPYAMIEVMHDGGTSGGLRYWRP